MRAELQSAILTASTGSGASDHLQEAAKQSAAARGGKEVEEEVEEVKGGLASLLPS